MVLAMGADGKDTLQQRKPGNAALSRHQLEEIFDLPSESACSFDSQTQEQTDLPRFPEIRRSPESFEKTNLSFAVTDFREKSALESEDLKRAALNFNSALLMAPVPRQPSLWTSGTSPQEPSEAGFGMKANRLVQEQTAFVQKVELELKCFGRTLDHHSCVQEALQKQLEDHSRVWRKDAESLAHDLQQLRAQLAQTMEAALWSGKEVASVRKEMASMREDRNEKLWPQMEPLDASLAERLKLVEERLETCNKHLAESNNFFAKAVSDVSQTVSQLNESVADMKLQVGTLNMENPSNPPVTPRRRDGIGDEMSRKPIEHSQLSQESESAPLKTTTPRGHSPVTDAKRGARLGGRKIPVR